MKTASRTWRPYTPREDRAIRRGWPDYRAIADALGRTAVGVRNRGFKLGLGSISGRKRYTDAERQMVLERYPREGPRPLARELGRSRECIVSLADRLGTGFDGLRRWTKEDDDRLQKLHHRKFTHAQIAAALGRSKYAVNERLRRFGLTVPLYDPAARRRMLIAPHRAVSRGSEERWARERLALGEHGWPPDLNPKEIAILESLRQRGPQSRRTLATSIGEPGSRCRYKLLMTHSGVSSLARIMARGLVTRLRLQNGRQQVYIYALTGNALKLRGTFQSVCEFNTPIAVRGVGSQPHFSKARKAS